MRAEAKDWETGGKYRQAVDSITNAVGLALGGKPTEGVLAGVGEAGAHYFTQVLYNTTNPEELTEAQKKTIADLSKVAGGVAAGLSSAASGGNSLTMASSVSDGIGIAESAVENNTLNESQSVYYLKELSEAIAQGKPVDEIHEKYKTISQAEFEKDLANCKQQGLMCYVGTLMAMDAGVKSAEGYKNFYAFPADIQAEALDFIRNEAAAHSIELVDGSPTMVQLALMAIEVGQEMYEAKNAGRSFATDRAQANFAKKIQSNRNIETVLPKVKTWEQAKVWGLLEEYNRKNPDNQIELKHLSYSLGVSSTKNAMNWASYKGMQLDNTTLEANTVGTSYPMTNQTIGGKLSLGLYDKGYTEKASGVFRDGKVSYAVAPRDIVGTGVQLPWVPGAFSLGIGNTNTTGSNTTGIPLWGIFAGDHTKAYFRYYVAVAQSQKIKQLISKRKPLAQ